ncbi:MAG: hypothetical protein GY696_05280 [Gammaproteobacteria bacterium]|nr:hypothetical protein [Gammaproteobacteria bacterium]
MQIWADTGAEVSTLTEGSYRTLIPNDVIWPTANIFKAITRAHQPAFGHATAEASFRGRQDLGPAPNCIPAYDTCMSVPPRLERFGKNGFGHGSGLQGWRATVFSAYQVCNLLTLKSQSSEASHVDIFFRCSQS